jgi:hypothetical protein
MTLADVVLVSALLVPYQTVLDASFRKEVAPNMSRYVHILLTSPTFERVFGKIHLAKKALSPKFNFDKLKEKSAAKPQPKEEKKKTQEAKSESTP